MTNYFNSFQSFMRINVKGRELHRIGHFCHCLIKIMSTKKLKIGENKRQKTEKGCENQ